MRLVHSAPLHVLVPLRIRTTAVFPVADVPPTTACAADEPKGMAVATNVESAPAMIAMIRENTVRRTNLRL